MDSQDEHEWHWSEDKEGHLFTKCSKCGWEVLVGYWGMREPNQPGVSWTQMAGLTRYHARDGESCGEILENVIVPDCQEALVTRVMNS